MKSSSSPSLFPSARPDKLEIYAKLLLTVFIWGASWIAGKVAVAEASPLMVASWRFFFAAIMLSAVLFARQGLPRWSAIQWLKLSALGVFGIFFYNVFFLYALQRVEAGRGALVVALSPVVIALVDRIVFGEKFTFLRGTGVFLALCGTLLVVTNGHIERLFNGAMGFGEFLLLGTVGSWVIYTFIVRVCAREFSALEMSFGGCVTGWVMLTVPALVEGSLFAYSTLTWRGISSILFLGIFATALAFTWYSRGISAIGTTMTAAFINLVPVFAVLLGALLLDERLSIFALAGGGLVICGVLLINLSKRKA